MRFLPTALLITVTLTFSLAVAQEAPPAAKTDLPPEAQQAIAEYDAQVVKINQQADEEIKAVRARAEQEIVAAREECRKALKRVQDDFTKAAKLDEAVAIRDRAAALHLGREILPDPGPLTKYESEIGKSFYFEVVGSSGGAVYGDGVYSSDSKLASAALHCGALKEGQKGVVRVTMLAGQGAYASTHRNGITSRDWSSWPFSYKVEPAFAEPAKPAGAEAKSQAETK